MMIDFLTTKRGSLSLASREVETDGIEPSEVDSKPVLGGTSRDPQHTRSVQAATFGWRPCFFLDHYASFHYFILNV